jgi:hypothetical protein
MGAASRDEVERDARFSARRRHSGVDLTDEAAVAAFVAAGTRAAKRHSMAGLRFAASR